LIERKRQWNERKRKKKRLIYIKGNEMKENEIDRKKREINERKGNEKKKKINNKLILS